MSLAICPGSFDPIHNGHVEVITRATKIFSGGVIVAVSSNPGKRCRFRIEERLEMVSEVFGWLDGVHVEALEDGLLADYARRKSATAIVKGLRDAKDFMYEAPMASMNRNISGVETLFLAGDPKNAHLSSSLIKEVASFGGDVRDFVPRSVARRMAESR